MGINPLGQAWFMPPAKVPEPDPRAQAHGTLIKERRLDLGLNRPAFVAQMQKHGQEITPDYLNKLERGTAPLSRASLEVREAIRAVLGYSPERWQELTGLYSPSTTPPVRLEQLEHGPQTDRTDNRDRDGVLDSREAGAFIRQVLADRGMQIQHLAAQTTVPDPEYLSNLLSGRIHVGKSKHFASIARVLELNVEDIAYINPNLVVQVVQQSAPGAPPVAPVVAFRDTPVVIPKELQQVIDEHGDRYPELRDPTIQKIIAAPRNFGGPDNGPQTVEDWYEYFLLTRRYLR